MKKNCPECNKPMIEVKYSVIDGNKCCDYPKDIQEPGLKRTFHEYRFYCSECLIEWIYNSLFRCFEIVPSDSQFYYESDKGILILRGNAKRT